MEVAQKLKKQNFESAINLDGGPSTSFASNTMHEQFNAEKILPIFKFTSSIDEIEDPWYTDNFEKVVNELTICIKDINGDIIYEIVSEHCFKKAQIQIE